MISEITPHHEEKGAQNNACMGTIRGQTVRPVKGI